MAFTHDFRRVKFTFLDGRVVEHPNTVDCEGTVEHGINWRVDLPDKIIFYPHHTIKSVVFHQREE